MSYVKEYQQQSISSFMYKVYAWMSAGLMLSAVTAYSIFSNPNIFNAIMGNMFIFFGLLIAQVAVVLLFSFRLRTLSYPTALALFLAYATLTGATLSIIFAVYQMTSIVSVFGITTAMFGIFALYGYVTRADLTSMGSLLLMALIGLIISSMVNMFMRSPGFDYVISFFGVLIFCGLTAYDTQKIKEMGYAMIGQGENSNKVALLGAFTLYLDFVNLFLYLLRFLGKKRD